MKLIFNSGLTIETNHPELITEKNGWMLIKDTGCKPDWSKLKLPVVLKVGRKAVRIMPS